MTKTNFQKYAGIALASTVVIGGIASATITPIPVISNSFAVAGQVIKSADINKLAEALNILDARTNGTAPTDPNHLADKEYVDGKYASISPSNSCRTISITGTTEVIVTCNPDEYAISGTCAFSSAQNTYYLDANGKRLALDPTADTTSLPRGFGCGWNPGISTHVTAYCCKK